MRAPAMRKPTREGTFSLCNKKTIAVEAAIMITSDFSISSGGMISMLS
jgi:hypothetical protein